MPALPNVSKVIRLDFLFELAGTVPALSRQFYRYSGSAPDLTDITVFADNAVAAYTGNCLGDLTAEKTFLGVEATDLSSATAAQALSPVSVAGTDGANPNPNDVALVVGYQIGRRYRGGHPRGYWPHGGEPNLADPRTWDSGSLSTFVGDLAAMQSSIIAGGWGTSGTITQVNVSYFRGFTVVTSPTTGRARNVSTPRSTPLVDTVVNYIGRPLIGNQRRRVGR